MKFKFSPLYAFRTLGVSILIAVAPLTVLFLVFGRGSFLLEYGIILAVILELPLVVIFWQYFFNDWNTVLELNFEEQVLKMDSPSNHLTVPFNDIKYIEYVLPPGIGSKAHHWLCPQDDYFYMKFHLQNGLAFKVTSLLLKGQEIKIEETAVQRKIKFLPFF